MRIPILCVVCVFSCSGNGGPLSLGGSGGTAGGQGGGNGGAGGLGGVACVSAYATTCDGLANPGSFEKCCFADADCVALPITVDCCGSAEIVAINKRDRAAFETYAKACRDKASCECIGDVTRTEDGAVPPTNGVGTACVAGTCRSFVASCTGACETPSASTSCRSCMSKPRTFFTCAPTCKTDGECETVDRRQTKCQEGFCTPPEIVCGIR